MENTHIQLWEECLKIFKDNLPAEQFNAWFKPITSMSFENNVLKLLVPTAYFVEQLEVRYMKILAATLHRVYGNNVKLFYDYYQVGADPTSAVTVETSRESPSVQRPSQNPFQTEVVEEFDSQLNPKYTFENYCGSVCNKIARSIGEAIAMNPKCKTFNPLFVFGHTGVGKTHLIQAIGIRIKERNPDTRVLYVPARLFESQYTAAAMAKPSRVNDFINFYQSIEVLIIDDIQDLMHKPGTQSAFFHIFNHLHQNQRQIPDFDLRREVLIQRASQDGLTIPAEVMEYIATNVTDSIRELEGIVVSLLAHATVLNRDITLELAKAVLSNSVKLQKRAAVNFEIVTQTVSDFYNIDPEQLFTKTRKREISDARQMVMYLAKRHVKMPVTAIGTRLSRTHATVLHACRNIEERLSMEAALRADVEKIEAMMHV